jgi:hypothetical protein
LLANKGRMCRLAFPIKQTNKQTNKHTQTKKYEQSNNNNDDEMAKL